MAEYTKRNLKEDVANSAEQFGMGENLETRFGSSDLELEKLAFSYQRFEPNFRLPFGHRQKEQEEVYVVIEGGGRVKLEDDVIEVVQWDAIRVPPETTRGFESGDEGMTLLAIGAPRVGAKPTDDGEMLPGWWSD